MSDTFAILEVSATAYDEISEALKKAGYSVERNGGINMEGIHLTRKESAAPVEPFRGRLRVVAFPTSQAMREDLSKSYQLKPDEILLSGVVETEAGRLTYVDGVAVRADSNDMKAIRSRSLNRPSIVPTHGGYPDAEKKND